MDSLGNKRTAGTRRIAAAHALVEGNTGLTLPAFRYKGRDRFLIPASLTHGFLIEMVE